MESILRKINVKNMHKLCVAQVDHIILKSLNRKEWRKMSAEDKIKSRALFYTYIRRQSLRRIGRRFTLGQFIRDQLEPAAVSLRSRDAKLCLSIVISDSESEEYNYSTETLYNEDQLSDYIFNYADPESTYSPTPRSDSGSLYNEDQLGDYIFNYAGPEPNYSPTPRSDSGSPLNESTTDDGHDDDD